MADIKQTKAKIAELRRSIQEYEAQRDDWAATIPSIENEIAITKPGPAQDEWKKMKEDAEREMPLLEAKIAAAHAEIEALDSELPETAEPAVPKFDPEKHPLLRKTVEKLEPEKAVVFSTGDMCEAQWTDKSWYKAKIQSILGSVSAPKYLVRFIEYDDTMTVDRSAVRPLPSKRKREPEPAAALSNAPVTSTPHVISGPASINPNAQAARKNTTNDDTEPKQASRVPNKGILKKRANNWNDFQAKAGKKMPKKESMFRTSTDIGSKVGFTGSGKGMTETHKRKRYDHKADADNDDEYAESAPQSRKRF